MLHDIDGRKINKTPYPESFKLLEERLTTLELAAARQALNSKIEGDEIHTAGWMPGADWRGTPFQPIFEKAARKNFELAAKLFGLLVWDVFMNRDDQRFTGKFELNGKDIGSRTYFRAT